MQRGSLDQKSQDAAAVGALVRMLKKAPPLGQDILVTTHYLQLRNHMHHNANENTQEKQQPDSTCSNLASLGLIASKTTADALNELRGYREIKDLLLKQEKIYSA
ncbi:hypothetical protein OROGR_008120 [Orobanche gracilis]